jgi:hypothetical protein
MVQRLRIVEQRHRLVPWRLRLAMRRQRLRLAMRRQRLRLVTARIDGPVLGTLLGHVTIVPPETAELPQESTLTQP